MSQDNATENSDNEPQPTPDSMSDGVSTLVNAISSVFGGLAKESVSADGKINILQVPAMLEKTANMLRYLNEAPNNTQNANPVPQVDAPSESPILFEDEWKLAISKRTGKILGIFPDNALAQRWYSDEAEEEIASKNALSSYDSAVARCREKVELIVKECRRTNRKFRDSEFVLDDEDLCLFPLDDKHNYGILPQGNAQTRKIFKKPQFYVDGATASDVKQGQAGDCWFLAGIAALTNFKACLTQNYVQVDGDEKVGVYGFVFHRDGEWIYEIVDDFLYTKNPRYGHLNGLSKQANADPLPLNMLRKMSEEKYSAAFGEGASALYFAQSRDENETWLPLLEKAFAKAHGDYWAIYGGHTGEAIEDLTGGITTELRTEDILDPDVLWQEVLLCNEQFIFGCWTPDWDDGESISEGLYSGHAYSIMKAVEVDVNGEKVRLVLVRNPWGNSEWNGRYSDGSREMNVALLTQLNHETGDDGMFYMAFEDFLRKFEYIDRIRLIGNDWSCAQCWTNIKVPRTTTFLDTKKYIFTMDRADKVVMSLSQLDDRYIRGLMGQYGFNLEFRLEKDGAEHAGRVIADSTRGINTERSVNAEIYLEAGKYNVFLRIVAEYDDDEKTVQDAVKYYVSTKKKAKLIQLAKKYNFAHMKHGVGDKEDRVFRSLTVQEADIPEGEKPKSDSDDANPTDGSAPATIDGERPESADEPVDHPVTEPTKPAPGKINKPEDKKDRSIENWNPVATIGLRLFTRKARVTLSVVQEVSDVLVLAEASSEDGKARAMSMVEPTILVSGESEKVGNVPPIGDPLPLTPGPKPSDAGIADPISPIVGSSGEDTSKAFVILDSNGSFKLSSSSSVPVSMSSGGVSEGAEKAGSAKSAAEQRIELKTKSLGDDKPYYLKVHEQHIVPETLDEFKLPWKWAPEPGYIFILGYLHPHEYEILFEHTRKLLDIRQLRNSHTLSIKTRSPPPSTDQPGFAPPPEATPNITAPPSAPKSEDPKPTQPLPPTVAVAESTSDKTDSSHQPEAVTTPGSGNTTSLEGGSPKTTPRDNMLTVDVAAASHETILMPGAAVVDSDANIVSSPVEEIMDKDLLLSKSGEAVTGSTTAEDKVESVS